MLKQCSQTEEERGAECEGVILSWPLCTVALACSRARKGGRVLDFKPENVSFAVINISLFSFVTH